MTAAPAKNPCGSCPYRKDVPSGVWAKEEYVKLPPYDNDTQDQPFGAFFCHQQDGRLCAGWVGCHDMRNNLGMRMAVSMGHLTVEEYEEAMDYSTDVPLWSSGAEAAAHGLKDVEDPGEQAVRVIERVGRKIAKKQGSDVSL